MPFLGDMLVPWSFIWDWLLGVFFCGQPLEYFLRWNGRFGGRCAAWTEAAKCQLPRGRTIQVARRYGEIVGCLPSLKVGKTYEQMASQKEKFVFQLSCFLGAMLVWGSVDTCFSRTSFFLFFFHVLCIYILHFICLPRILWHRQRDSDDGFKKSATSNTHQYTNGFTTR